MSPVFLLWIALHRCDALDARRTVSDDGDLLPRPVVRVVPVTCQTG